MLESIALTTNNLRRERWHRNATNIRRGATKSVATRIVKENVAIGKLATNVTKDVDGLDWALLLKD